MYSLCQEHKLSSSKTRFHLHSICSKTSIIDYRHQFFIQPLMLLLGIHMRIMCLTRSMWKVRNGEARSAVEMTLCCPPPIPLHGSASKVSSSSGDAQVISCHRYLVVFHSFVEQLTVFHTSGLVLASSSILRVLDLHLHHAMASWAACAKQVHKLFLNPYISTVNP